MLTTRLTFGAMDILPQTNLWDRALFVWCLVSGMIRSSFGNSRAWEASVCRIEQKERARSERQPAILFLGSSSIMFWRTLENDMAPLQVRNYGFGGAKFRDINQYLNRLLALSRPRGLVLFAGTNEIAGRKPAQANQILEGFKNFVAKVRSDFPDLPIIYIAITPTPLRWRHWNIANESNALIKRFIDCNNQLTYVDIAPSLIGTDGKPNRSFYHMDGLHPNAKGYELWTRLLRPILCSINLTESG